MKQGSTTAGKPDSNKEGENVSLEQAKNFLLKYQISGCKKFI